MTSCLQSSASFKATKITTEETWICFFLDWCFKRIKNIIVTGDSALQSPDSKSQILQVNRNTSSARPQEKKKKKRKNQNRIYSQSKANQRKRTKVHHRPELFVSKEVSDVWVNNVLLLQRARNVDCLGNTLPWWKVLTLWLLKGQDLDSGVFTGKSQIQTE